MYFEFSGSVGSPVGDIPYLRPKASRGLGHSADPSFHTDDSKAIVYPGWKPGHYDPKLESQWPVDGTGVPRNVVRQRIGGDGVQLRSGGQLWLPSRH